MSISELETDPLVAEDPLDCSKEIIRDEHLEENWIKFEPDFRLSGAVVEAKNDFRPSPKLLRVGKWTGTGSSEVEEEEDDSDVEWKPDRGGSAGRNASLNGERRADSERATTDSDEENAIPLARPKARRKGRKVGAPKRSGVTRGRKDFPCGICHRTFSSATILNEHVSNFCRSESCEDRLESFDDSKGSLKVFDIIPRVEKSIGGEKLKKDEGTIHQVRASAPGDRNERSKKYYEQLKNERKYQCEVCQKTFITSGHLNTHMYRHSGKKWTCDGCGKNFSCERSLVRHRDTFPGEHWFPCKFCDVTFFRASNIAKHMEIKHPEASMDGSECGDRSRIKIDGDDAPGMDESGRCFSNSDSSGTFPGGEIAREEETSVREGDATVRSSNDAPEEGETGGKYKCEVCSKQFVSLEGFEYHRSHQHVEGEVKRKRRKRADDEGNDEGMENKSSEQLSFVCKICSAAFPQRTGLQTHLKTHNVTKNVEVKSGSHQCCICPRSFTSSDGLKYHLATHTGERRYSCGQCGKRFIKKTHLSEHVATHSEVKYFRCPRCPRTFSTHSAYRKHIKHFPGPHSFPCRKCGKLFTKESMIEKHMCVDLVKITMAPEVKALLSEDMIEEYLCLAEEQMARELSASEDPRVKESPGSTSYSCYKCFKVYPNLSSLRYHQKDHIGKQNYQCRFCPENFKRADAFGAHIRNHLGSTPYMCLKCNRKFISPFTLSMHAKNYPGDHSFVCHKCRRWFPSEKRLEKHECILQNSDHFRCACGSAFASWNELLQHAGTKPYKCCMCELKYPTLTALARHIKKHTGVKPFSCEVCGKSFRAKNNYLNHKKVHRNAEEFRCEHCEYKSKSQKRLNFHLFRKHDIGSNAAKSTLCPICGVIFPYISHMKRHLEMDHGNGLILDETAAEKKALPAELCTLCGKMLNNKYTLANHMKKVHDPNAPKKDRSIKCEFCEEKFHTVKKLQRHAEIHEAPGLRSCDVCHKEFYFAKELRKHMRKHDTNKPFSCTRCGKHFKVSVSLKYHSTICGNVSQRASNSRKKKEAEEPPSLDVLYGHINPIDLNSQSCMIQVCGR